MFACFDFSAPLNSTNWRRIAQKFRRFRRLIGCFTFVSLVVEKSRVLFASKKTNADEVRKQCHSLNSDGSDRSRNSSRTLLNNRVSFASAFYWSLSSAGIPCRKFCWTEELTAPLFPSSKRCNLSGSGFKERMKPQRQLRTKQNRQPIVQNLW